MEYQSKYANSSANPIETLPEKTYGFYMVPVHRMFAFMMIRKMMKYYTSGDVHAVDKEETKEQKQ